MSNLLEMPVYRPELDRARARQLSVTQFLNRIMSTLVACNMVLLGWVTVLERMPVLHWALANITWIIVLQYFRNREARGWWERFLEQSRERQE